MTIYGVTFLQHQNIYRAGKRGKSWKKTTCRIAVAAAAVGAGGVDDMPKARATPATLGFYPSSDIYEKGNFHLDVDTYGKGLKTDAAVTTGLTYGLGPERSGFLGRSEIGFDYILSVGGVSPSNLGISTGKRLLGNIKTQLYDNPEKGLRLVAGFWGVGDNAVAAPNVGYLLGAKSFEWGRVHAGVAQAFSSRAIVATPAGNSQRTHLQLGYDRYFSKKLQFCVDYYSGKSAYAGVQPTLYYFMNDKSDFGIGYMRFNDRSVTPSRNQIYLCFDYNFK